MALAWTDNSFSLERAMQIERPRLVRLCARISGNAQAADDLAQETLTEAWRNAHKLVDPSGVSCWLSAIARNVCLRWQRRQGRDSARRVDLPLGDELVEAVAISLPDEVDLLGSNLEHEDLSGLLDRAMDFLPAKTRQIMTHRYLDETPLTEIADYLGMKENTVAVQLHRGREALSKVLATQFQEELVAYGIPLPADNQWHETRIWCPRCGQHRLRGSFTESIFVIHCPGCAVAPDDNITERGLPDGLIDQLKGYKPALARSLTWGYHYYKPGLTNGVLNCYACGRPARMKLTLPSYAPARHQGQPGFHMACDHCQAPNYGTLDQYALSLPEVQQFWRKYPRIHLLPQQELMVDNQPGLKITVENVAGPGRLDLLFHRSSYQVLGIQR